MIAGLALVPSLNVSLKPVRTYRNLQVSFSWPDASPRVVEQRVTSKLEALFSTVKGVKYIESESSQGGGEINIKFKKGTDIDAARFEIATIIRRVYSDLPQNVSYPVISSVKDFDSYKKNDNTLLVYTLNADVSPYFIQKYALENIVPRIAKIDGVSSVDVTGANPYVWEIEYNLNQIQSLGLSYYDIAKAVNNYFKEEVLGLADVNLNGLNKRTLKIVLKNNIPKEINWDIIPIKNINGRIIHLGDIAKTRFKEGTPTAYYRINGLNTITINIKSSPDANIIKLASIVRKRMQKIERELPGGYHLMLMTDNSSQIKKELNKILRRTLFSLLILFLFVFFVSFDVKYLLLITISIIANLSLAIFFYKLMNVQIHLYSLAGITVSFGIIIDNSIVMIEHLRSKGDRKIFMAILASTLTTIASLSVIYMLPEKQRLNLIDFGIVIIINIFVSLVVALFLVPALFEKIPLKKNNKKSAFKHKRRIIKFSHFYENFIILLKKYKLIPILLFIFVFGIPFGKLPDEINKKTKFAQFYNKTLGSEFFIQNIKPYLAKYLGGTVSNFTDYVSDNAHFSNPERTKLEVYASITEGRTIEQLNETMKKMEKVLKTFKEIESFRTTINKRYGNITIYFKPEYEKSDFPFYLKKILVKEAINLGGADWSIWGVGKAFSNSTDFTIYPDHIGLVGYDYDKLSYFADSLRKRLLQNPHINEVEITGYYIFLGKKSHEYVLSPIDRQMAINNISLIDLYTPLKNILFNNKISDVIYHGNYYPVVMKSSLSKDFDLWKMKNYMLKFGNKYQKLSNLATLKFQQKNKSIYRVNQNYRLVLNYSFNGPALLADKFKKKVVEQISSILPIGFRCLEDPYSDLSEVINKQNIWLLFIIIVMIYFICSILFESFDQPFAIIFMIPVSFIGIFLTFIIFKFRFDQGGMASFILLSGITVNSGIYIINDFNKYGKKTVRDFVKAFNYKIFPISLTILSTILGLVPFVYKAQNDTFWFSFAVGAMGGLVFSYVSILIYLPLFLKMEKI